MKNFKKLIAAATIVGTLGVLGVAGVAYAAGAKTPAGIVSALTGKSAEQITAERAAGKTYGTIAQEAGKLDEFKAENLVQKKALLDQRVKDGYLTQEQADAMYKSMEVNQATCDGTGSAGMGQRNCGGFGQGMGRG
ncbi:MAG TPA: hypothetical protein VFF14_07890, partial [Candidatus Deferrimicrobium sp.]|nr:hypothetical protein [Candidatus Deferrimicrobium sp.]